MEPLPESMAGCKRGRDQSPDDGWQHSTREMSTNYITVSETGSAGACKLARYGPDLRAGEDGVEPKDPFDALVEDILQCHILTLLDSRSLARCAAVSARWRPLATAEKLWQPLVVAFLAKRVHLPLCLMGRDFSSSRMSQRLVYAIAATDSRQRELVPAEMCGRTWELRLKPPCGPYWLGFDPTQVGQPGLNRYFHCDGSISSDPNDPIWGGHACAWKFIRVQGRDGTFSQLVQINHWPPLTVRRLHDGRWTLENSYGLYITRPDNPAFCAGRRCATRSRDLCSNSCSPPTYGFQI